MDPTNDSPSQLKTLQGKYSKTRGRRQQERRRTHSNPVVSATQQKQLEPVDPTLLKRYFDKKNAIHPHVTILDIEREDESFSQIIQARSCEIDEDSQLSEMYWYGIGAYRNDVEAVLNSHW